MLSKILLGLLVLVITLVLVALLIGYLVSAPHYTGPVSDHFDGKTFFTPGAVQPKGFFDLIKWQLNHERSEAWPPYHAEATQSVPPGRVQTDTAADGRAPIRVTYVNHSTILMQFDGLNVLTDPIYEKRVSPFQFIWP